MLNNPVEFIEFFFFFILMLAVILCILCSSRRVYRAARTVFNLFKRVVY
jgi:hypothetical protein